MATATPLYLRQVALAARDLDKTVDHICAVFDTDVRHRDTSIAEFGLHNAVIGLGAQFMEVVSPLNDAASASRFIERRGEGLYALLLQCEDDEHHRARIDELGIRRLMELEHGDFRCFQLHPSDARTSVLLEIDRQPDPPHGRYYPGGNTAPPPGASKAGRLTGVTIPGPDPGQLAARWAQLLGRPLASDAASVDLDNASLRFPAGEPAGATVDVVVPDPDRATEVAAARGLEVGPGRVTIGGLHFSLTSSESSTRTNH